MTDAHPELPVEPDEAKVGLEAFRQQPDDRGLSLSELSDAFAEMLTTGRSPYETDPKKESEENLVDMPSPELPDGEPAAAHVTTDPCEVSPRSILEAMLFVGNPGNEPLTSARVAGLMRGVRPSEIDELVQDLNRQYRASGCPYHIISEKDGYRLTLRDEYTPLRDKFYGRLRQARLSPAAIEVLSLVAYRGPLTADKVACLRGRPSGAILSLLVRRQLLRIERKDEARKTAHYHITNRFLELFGLESLEDLPRSQDLEKR